jgi:multidrug efflux pump subunit AcrA (membrane-fusion protein)
MNWLLSRPQQPFVGAREALLEIAPSDEQLVVELRIDPHDIDHVRPGDATEVRLSAFDRRGSPLLPAQVTTVSSDAVTGLASHQRWYLAQMAMAPQALAKHPLPRLQAGMPAEVFVTTPPRSLLRYLLEPLGLFARRALREP